jgi:PAS domain S-box-containing protein
MSIRRETLLVAVGVFAALCLVLVLILSGPLVQRLRELEYSRVRSDVLRVREGLKNEEQALARAARDYGEWDQTVEFVQKPSAEYIDSNLGPSAYKSNKANLCLIADAQASVVFRAAYDFERSKEAPPPAPEVERTLVRTALVRALPGDGLGGLYVVGGEPLLVGAHPVMIGNSAKVYGVFIFGRYLTQPELKSIAAMTQVSFSLKNLEEAKADASLSGVVAHLSDPESSSVRELSRWRIAGYTVLPDITGQSAVLVVTEQDRPFFNRARGMVKYLVVLLLATVVVFVGAFLLIVEWRVLKPLTAIAQEVRAVDILSPAPHRVSERRGVEFGRLARSINEMLAATHERTVELHHSQEALSGSEARFRALIERGSDLVLIVDTAGTITYASPSVARELGYAESEVAGRPVFDILDPAYRERARQHLAELLDHPDAVVQVQTRVGRKGGGAVDLQVVARNELANPAVGGIVVNAYDITERRRHDDDLRKLSQAVEQSPSMVVITGPEGLIEYVNPRFAALTGHHPDEAIGCQAVDFLPPDLDSETRLELERLPEMGAEWRGELRGLRKDGTLVWVALSITPIRDSAGTITRRLIIGEDVTERRLAEQALAESQLAVTTILSTSREGFLRIDNEGLIVDLNSAACDLLGRSAEEILGRPREDFADPESLAVLQEQHELRRQDVASTYELRLLRPDGAPVHCLVNATPLLNEEGQVLGAVSMLADITARKLAEELARRENAKLAAMISGMQEGVLFADAKGTIVEANAYFCQLMGMNRDEVLGRDVVDIHRRECPDAADQVSATLAAYRSGENVEPVTTQRPLRGREVIWRVQPIYRDTLFDGILVNITNVTELVEARRVAEAAAERINTFATELEVRNAELDEALIAARAAADAKSEFLARVSHEIRTPMNGIIGMTSLLLDTSLTTEQREFGNIVQGSAQALMAIINDILDFSKIEAGKLDLEEIDFDLVVVVEDTAELLSPRAHEKGLELGVLFDHDVPVYLRGDPGRLRQVLTNLVGNAVKFTERGEVLVRVVLEAETDGDVSVLFEVEDTGIGVPQDKTDRLFVSFSQVDRATTRRYGGTGLGLAISKQLAELMGGRVGVRSREGKGSVFWFTACFRKREPLPALVPLARDELTGKRVLIADDHASNRYILRHQLSGYGCVVAEVEHGMAALEALRAAAAEQPYDVAIIDYSMPQMTGTDVARSVRGDPQIATTPLILLTSAARRGDAAVALKAGFNAYLVKPVKQKLLFECIATVLGAEQAGQAPSAALITRHSLREALRKRLSILLAEDNVINQQVAVRFLERAGHQVSVVADGRQAVEAAASGSFDLVLMDCLMPGMDGYEATRAIRALPGEASRVPVIAMTANVMRGDREACLAAGMNDYLGKPVDPAELFAAIERQTGASELAGTPAPPAESPGGGEPPPAVEAAAPPLDVKQSLARAGDPEFWHVLLASFAEETPRRMEAAAAALSAGDLALVQREAHTIKGSAAEIAAQPLGEAALALELAAKGGDAQAAQELYDALTVEWGRLRDSLESL